MFTVIGVISVSDTISRELDLEAKVRLIFVSFSKSFYSTFV